MQFFYQYTTGIVLLGVAVSVLIYRDTYLIACIVIRIVSDDSRIVPALLKGNIQIVINLGVSAHVRKKLPRLY